MKPASLALLALLFALPAAAQEKAKPAEKAREAAEAPRPAETPAVQFWRWFIGPKEGKGAYAAGPLVCATEHQLLKAHADSRSRSTSVRYEGHSYGVNWLESVGSNKALCLNNDTNSIPVESLLPNPPWRATEWFKTTKNTKVIATAYLDYDKATSAPTALADMKAARTAFYDAALADVLSDDAARAVICSEVELGPNCASVIGAKKPAELYLLGRAAVEKP
jgi:hypothetical protein